MTRHIRNPLGPLVEPLAPATHEHPELVHEHPYAPVTHQHPELVHEHPYAPVAHDHYLSQVPAASVRRVDDTQQYASGLEYAMFWQASRYDNGHLWGAPMWDGNTALFCRLAGVYFVWGTLYWGVPQPAAIYEGQRSMHLVINNSLKVFDDHATFNNRIAGPTNGGGRELILSPGDYLQMHVLQQSWNTFDNSVGTANVLAVNAISPEMGMSWRGPVPT